MSGKIEIITGIIRIITGIFYPIRGMSSYNSQIQSIFTHIQQISLEEAAF